MACSASAAASSRPRQPQPTIRTRAKLLLVPGPAGVGASLHLSAGVRPPRRASVLGELGPAVRRRRTFCASSICSTSSISSADLVVGASAAGASRPRSAPRARVPARRSRARTRSSTGFSAHHDQREPDPASLKACRYASGAMPDACIVDALRTPVGRYGGALAGVRPDDLAAHVIARGRRAHGARPGGDDRGRLLRLRPTRRARTTATWRAWPRCSAGCRSRCPGVTVNRLCASGLEAVNQAARADRAGEGDLLLAGGVESMTPRAVRDAEARARLPARRPRAATTPRSAGASSNPTLAELLRPIRWARRRENVAESYGVSREDQDAFALESHRRAVAARRPGRFDDEIVAVDVPQRKGDPVTVARRRGPAPRHLARAARQAAARCSARAAA